MRTHPKVLAPAIALEIFLIASAIVINAYFGMNFTGTAGTIWTAVVIAWWALGTLGFVVPRVYRWATTVWTITPTEVRVRKGLIWTQTRSMRLDRIISIDVERGLLDRMVGCATLSLSDASDPNAFVMHDLPRYQEVEARLRGTQVAP